MEQQIVDEHDRVIGREGRFVAEVLDKGEVLLSELHIQDSLLGGRYLVHPAVDHRVVLFQGEPVEHQAFLPEEGQVVHQRVFLHHPEESTLVSVVNTVGHQLEVAVVFLLAYLEYLFVEGRLVQ